MQPRSIEPIKIPPEPKQTALQERRLTMRLMALWQDIRNGRPCPLADSFDPEKVPDLWPDCFLLEPAAEWTESRFTHVGDRLAALSNLTRTDITLDQVPASTLLSTALRSAGDVLRVKHPLLDSGEYLHPGGTRFLYRAILLPLEGKNGNIGCLLGGARQKAIEGVG